MKRVVSLILAMLAMVVIAGTGTEASALKYTALGDSVAAGAGLPTSDATCGRSTQAYPYTVAASLGTTAVHLACTGAKVDEGLYGVQHRNGVRLEPQLNAAFVGGVPDVMTVTIGANDARWVQFLRYCYLTSCGNRYDSAAAKIYRADLRVELYWFLSKVQAMSAGDPPQVLLNGYYNTYASSTCDDTKNFTAAERTWLRARTADLNQAIRSVLPYFSFAEYVPVDFTGHELCSSQSWVQGPLATSPFHPTAAGQAAIARANLAKIER